MKKNNNVIYMKKLVQARIKKTKSIPYPYLSQASRNESVNINSIKWVPIMHWSLNN